MKKRCPFKPYLPFLQGQIGIHDLGLMRKKPCRLLDNFLHPFQGCHIMAKHIQMMTGLLLHPLPLFQFREKDKEKTGGMKKQHRLIRPGTCHNAVKFIDNAFNGHGGDKPMVLYNQVPGIRFYLKARFSKETKGTEQTQWIGNKRFCRKGTNNFACQIGKTATWINNLF